MAGGEKFSLNKIAKTSSLYFTFWMMGLSSCLLGTTFVHLEKLFHVAATEISNILVIFSVGYLIGAIICAFIYDKGVPEYYFVAFNLLSALSSIVAGVVENIYIFTTAIALQGCGFGFDDAAGQSYCVNLWSNHRLQRPILQAAHAIWSFGGILGPIIVKTFLCEFVNDRGVDIESSFVLAAVNKNDEENKMNFDLENISTDHNNSQFFDLNSTESCNTELIEYTRYAFYTVGGIIIGANLPFLIITFNMCCRCNRKNHTKSKVNIIDLKTEDDDVQFKERLNSIEVEVEIKDSSQHYEFPGMSSKIMYVALLFLFAMLNLYVENLPICFLVSFALKHLGWSVFGSSVLLSAYFAAHFLGRIIAVVTSIYVRPLKMLVANIVVTALACSSLLLCDKSPFIVWAAVIVAGFGISNTFPTTILWVSETIPVSGKISSILIIGSSVGTISAPYFVALFSGIYGEFSFIYVLTAAALSHVLIFASLYLFLFKVVGKF